MRDDGLKSLSFSFPLSSHLPSPLPLFVAPIALQVQGGEGEQTHRGTCYALFISPYQHFRPYFIRLYKQSIVWFPLFLTPQSPPFRQSPPRSTRPPPRPLLLH